MALGERFDQAFLFASALHRSQLRKTTSVPYLSHLLAVTSLVLEHGGDEDEAIAALLHDAVEDQGGLPTLEQIRSRFGERVAEIVKGCTDAWTKPKPPWLERKRAYLEHLRTASSSVRLVSAADKLHNARSVLKDYLAIGEALWSRFNSGRDQQLWYYRALADTFSEVGPAPLACSLERVVGELERLVAQR